MQLGPDLQVGDAFTDLDDGSSGRVTGRLA